MSNYSIDYIKAQIDEKIASIYKNACNFSKAQLYNESMRILCNVSDMRCIAFANDLGVPPVKTTFTLLGKMVFF